MQLTIEQQMQTLSNDYSALEQSYGMRTDTELVRDPYRSVYYAMPDITLSASIIIPAFNSRSTLEQCLIAIEQSSFNRKYPELLEVVVIDDGSTDGTWELLEQLQLGVHLKAVRQEHYHASHARNTAIAHAEGDIIICCDSDMLLTPFSIEELVKRHQILDNVLLVGFRENIMAEDPRIQVDVIAKHLPSFLPPFMKDLRLQRLYGGPENICLNTDHLKRLGEGRKVFLGSVWESLPILVWGALFSIRRSDFLTIGGFDERFHGWGYEDTLLAAQAIALGNYVIPVYSAAGLHITHKERTEKKLDECAVNYQMYQKVLSTPLQPADPNWIKRAMERVTGYTEQACTISSRGTSPNFYEAFDVALADPYQRGEYFYALGRYEEAIKAFAEVSSASTQKTFAVLLSARALRASGYADQSVDVLKEIVSAMPAYAEALVELGIALARENHFVEAKRVLERALQVDPMNQLVVSILTRSVAEHIMIAEAYVHQQDLALSLEPYEFALIKSPFSLINHALRAKSLSAINGTEEGIKDHKSYVKFFSEGNLQRDEEYIEQLWHCILSEEWGGVKLISENIKCLEIENEDLSACLAELDDFISNLHPTSLVSTIVKQCEKIPGDFDKEEMKLLVTLLSQFAAKGDRCSLSTVMEVGSFCGQATVAMGLTLRKLERTDIRIFTVDKASPAPDGWPASAVLSSNLRLHHLDEWVTCSFIEDETLLRRKSQFLLIHGKDNNSNLKMKIRHCILNFAPKGLLLFHDYSDAFPSTQQYINELIDSFDFEVVAQVGSLIALRRKIQKIVVKGEMTQKEWSENVILM